MKFIILPILLLYILNYPSPDKDIKVEEIYVEKMKEEEMIQNKRKLNIGKVVYKNPESVITIYNHCIIETISLIIKAEGGTVTDFYIPSAVAII